MKPFSSACAAGKVARLIISVPRPSSQEAFMNRILSSFPNGTPHPNRPGGPGRSEPTLPNANADRYVVGTTPDSGLSELMIRAPRPGLLAPGLSLPTSLLGERTQSAAHGTLFQEDDGYLEWETEEALFSEPWLKSDGDPDYDESWDEPLYPDQQFHGKGLPRSRDFPLEVRQSWQRCFEATPREFFETLFDTSHVKLGEYSFAVQEGAEGWSEVSMEMDLDSPSTGRPVGRMDRLFRFPRGGEPSVHHQLFELDPQLQGKGVAKELLANSVELYEQAGISKVTLFAALDVGGYAWAKYGFCPEPGRATRELFSSIRERLAELDGVAEPVRAVVGRLLDSEDPKAVWAISDLEGISVPNRGEKTPLGKALLLGTHWKGQLLLDDPEARARFDHYTSNHRKAGQA